jgi:hypothetical protein
VWLRARAEGTVPARGRRRARVPPRHRPGDAESLAAVLAALAPSLDFINLFLFWLRSFGRAR